MKLLKLHEEQKRKQKTKGQQSVTPHAVIIDKNNLSNVMDLTDHTTCDVIQSSRTI